MPPAFSFRRRTPAQAMGGVLGVSALISLAACGGGGDGSDVASLGTLAASEASTPTGTTPADNEDAILAYTQCLRDQGLDVEDPTFDADGNINGGFFGPESGLDPGSAEFEAAQDACGSLMEGITLGGGAGEGVDIEAMQAASLNFTECLRDEGLEVDDLDFSMQGPGAGPGGGAGDGSLPTGSIPEGGPPEGGQGGGDPTGRLVEVLGLDPDDPTVVAAMDACEDVLTGALPQGAAAAGTTEP